MIFHDEYNHMAAIQTSSGGKLRALFASLCAILIFSVALVATLKDVRTPAQPVTSGYGLVSVVDDAGATKCTSSGDERQNHPPGHSCAHLCGLCQITSVNDRGGIVSVSLDDLIETLVPVSDPARRVELTEDNRVLYREGWINSWSATAPPSGRSLI